jgi:glucokinase
MGEYYIGIDVGGTSAGIAVVDEHGSMLAKDSIPTGMTPPFQTIVAALAERSAQLVKIAGLDGDAIQSVGIGVPSTIDPKTGHVVFANNLNWRDLDLVSECQKYWQVPIYLENDADCAAVAESWEGPARGRNVLVITVGTGLGGGLIMNGKIFKGGDNSGFEPGHSVLVHGGERCTCGNAGCAEAYASVTALIRQTREAMRNAPDSLLWQECGGDPAGVTGRTAFDAAKKGDQAAQKTVADYIEYLASSIANLITLFRPELVIIGGGISAEGDYLLKPLRESAGRRIYAWDILTMPPFMRARLGNDAGMIGAALLGKIA